MVCLSWATKRESGVVLRDEGLRLMRRWLEDPNVRLIAHNAAYDTAVICNEDNTLLPPMFDAYTDGRISCTELRERLKRNAHGEWEFAFDHNYGRNVKSSYGLADLEQFYRLNSRDRRKEKTNDDAWRLRYNELDGVPIDEWPKAAYEYALYDAVYARRLYLAQIREGEPTVAGPIVNDDGTYIDEANQTRAQFWIRLMAAWGIRTEETPVSELKARVKAESGALNRKLSESGILRANGTKNIAVLRERIWFAYDEHLGEEPPTTPKGAIQYGTEALEPVAPYDHVLKQLVESSSSQKLLSTFVPALERGTVYPITPDFRTLVQSGRTSCGDPNLQNISKLPGVRECFVPRAGYWFAGADYDGLELRTLAQTCVYLFGHSRMADAINNGLDLHTSVASQLLKISYEETLRWLSGECGKRKQKKAEKTRHLAKILNFGLPGGMAGRTFAGNATKNGHPLTPDEGNYYRQQWLLQWPEMEEYFKYINFLCRKGGGEATVRLPWSGRQRRTGYTNACNTWFQGWAADGAKLAGWNLAKAMYTDRNSPLFGCRTVNFIHDEFIIETPIEVASEAAEELARVMVASMDEVVDQVRGGASACLMTRWRKSAKPVRGAFGELIPWEP